MTVTARSSARGAPAYTDSYRCTPDSAREARRFVTAALHTWHMDALVHGAGLVVSELVTNAVEHARSRELRVTVTRTADHAVHIGVVDKDPAQPKQRTARPGDERGRGLAVVDAFSERWGVDRLAWGGKRVWAELEEK